MCLLTEQCSIRDCGHVLFEIWHQLDGEQVCIDLATSENPASVIAKSLVSRQHTNFSKSLAGYETQLVAQQQQQYCIRNC